MKKIVYLIAILFITSATYGQKVNFSGNWKLNKEKSELGEQFSMAPNSIEITMDKATMTEVRHSSFQGEDFTFTDKYTLDGKECENKGWMDSIKKSKANWNGDKSSLNIVTKIPMQDGEMTVTYDYSMKGSSMVIKSTASSSFGEITEVQVYDKK